MTKLETVERQVRDLSPEELDKFREWFTEFDWKLWDEELERDVAEGKLDAFVKRARENVKRGKAKEL